MRMPSFFYCVNIFIPRQNNFCPALSRKNTLCTPANANYVSELRRNYCSHPRRTSASRASYVYCDRKNHAIGLHRHLFHTRREKSEHFMTPVIYRRNTLCAISGTRFICDTQSTVTFLIYFSILFEGKLKKKSYI